MSCHIGKLWPYIGHMVTFLAPCNTQKVNNRKFPSVVQRHLQEWCLAIDKVTLNYTLRILELCLFPFCGSIPIVLVQGGLVSSSGSWIKVKRFVRTIHPERELVGGSDQATMEKIIRLVTLIAASKRKRNTVCLLYTSRAHET